MVVDEPPGAELSPAERARRMESGRAAWNRGDFYEAHEDWEAVWNLVDDPDRTWIQGLIQLATGLHKLDRGREDVCAKLLHKGLAKLAAFDGAPPALDGVDVATARAGATRILDAIARGELPPARGVTV